MILATIIVATVSSELSIFETTGFCTIGLAGEDEIRFLAELHTFEMTGRTVFNETANKTKTCFI